jgi:general secretion pathway protein C
MRLRVNPRGEWLLGRLPRPSLLSGLEWLLLALIAVQGARLVWTIVTPVGPLGDYRDPAMPAPTAASADFDPFFRLAANQGPANVTSLNLRLYGVREDRATGRGSAIIALPDGRQSSFAVGDEIMPGVRLTGVAFDSVTIDRQGNSEQIFLDQSTPAPAAAPAGASPAAPAPAAAPVVQSPPVASTPRVATDRVEGLTVSAGADGGAALRAAGLAPGDVILSVNGQPVSSVAQARAAAGSGGEAAIVVQRGARQMSLRVRLPL